MQTILQKLTEALTKLSMLISQVNSLTGVQPDPRPIKERQKDWSTEELSPLKAPTWLEKQTKDWRSFPIRNQATSFTCVAQSTATLLGIENALEAVEFLDFSARDIYDRRQNKPGEGMWGNDAMQIATEYGSCLELTLPSQGMTEDQVTKPFVRTEQMEKEELKYRAGGYITLDHHDIDEIAATIEQKKKGVVLFFKFKENEWQYVPYIKSYFALFNPLDSSIIGHAVVAVDFTIYNGKKALIIQDSAFRHTTHNGRRIITEDFLKARAYYAGYLLSRPNTDQSKPRWKFTRDALRYGDESEAVYNLQQVLKYEGLFPSEEAVSGKYGQITRWGVKKFQERYKVASEAEIAEVDGMAVGPKTLAQLTKLYG